MLATKKPTAAEQAANFVAKCAELGWSWSCRSEVVAVQKSFAPNDRAAYADCDMTAHDLINMVPARGGSVWGTDAFSVGGHAGMSNGYYRLHVSGVAKRFTAALEKLV